jgi:hypothetical protein
MPNAAWTGIIGFLNSDAGKKYSDAGIKFDFGKLYADYDINNPEELAHIWGLIEEMFNDEEFKKYLKEANYDMTNG